MTFKKLYIYLFTVFAISFSACDIIEEPFFEDNTSGGAVIENPQKVLIMDYTGHTCKSCPKAHNTIHMIKQVYGDQIIPVAFHLGYFAKPMDDGKYDTDFRTDEGEVLENHFDFVSFPIGTVNRLGKDDLIPYPSWAAETADYVENQAQVIIEVTTSYNSATKKATAAINVAPNGTESTTLKLAVYLTESHIISYQKDEDATPMDVPDYEHNHVFRDAAGSIWGEVIDFSSGDEDGLNFVRNIEINPEWVAENCSFVIFVYDSSSMEVVQAEEVEIRS